MFLAMIYCSNVTLYLSFSCSSYKSLVLCFSASMFIAVYNVKYVVIMMYQYTSLIICSFDLLCYQIMISTLNIFDLCYQRIYLLYQCLHFVSQLGYTTLFTWFKYIFVKWFLTQIWKRQWLLWAMSDIMCCLKVIEVS